jgi:hypothetical protein
VVLTFLSEPERQAWLANVERTDPLLLEFAQRLDDLCETALEMTGRVLPVEHAASILLRDAAEADSPPGRMEARVAA